MLADYASVDCDVKRTLWRNGAAWLPMLYLAPRLPAGVFMSELSRKSLSLPDAVAAGFLLAGVVACANDGGDAHVEMRAPARGLVYAREACASCHAVEVGEFNSPNAAAPSFAALAGRPDMTRSTLSALLRSPHRNMPNLIVEPDRVDDLAAYLSALGNGG